MKEISMMIEESVVEIIEEEEVIQMIEDILNQIEIDLLMMKRRHSDILLIQLSYIKVE